MSTAVAAQQSKPAFSLQDALKSIETTNPDAAIVLTAAIKKDIRVLGTDEIFALRDSSGDIKAFKQSLTLSIDNGGLVQPVYNGPYVVSAQGYTMWAEATGSSVIFPKDVNVNGDPMPNLTPIRDKINGRILYIPARAVAFRYSSKGIPQVVDRVAIYDAPSYRMIDLLGKAKKYPQAFRLLPSKMKGPEEAGTWADYVFDESTTLWINTAHDEALSWFAQIMNREKKSMELAQTFGSRNALKWLSGIQKSPGPSWTFPVICWRPVGNNIIKWDAAQYYALQDKVGRLNESCGAEFEPGKALQIECKTGTDLVSDETGFETIERGDEPEDHVPEVLPPEASEAPKAELSPEDKKILAQLEETKKLFPDEFKIACDELKVDPSKPISASAASGIMGFINGIIDRAGE